jgi:hypothetical protein
MSAVDCRLGHGLWRYIAEFGWLGGWIGGTGSVRPLLEREMNERRGKAKSDAFAMIKLLI